MSLLFALSGTAVVSKTLRIPKFRRRQAMQCLIMDIPRMISAAIR
jgi:hypothetical protein